MTEKHYAHLAPNYAERICRALPSFDFRQIESDGTGSSIFAIRQFRVAFPGPSS
jgi:hypothetical protein